MSKKILAFLLFSACAFAQSTTTVTGNLKNLGTGSVSSNSFVRFYLRGCAGNQPRINGTAIIAPTQGNVYYFDFVPNGSGAISGTLYSTRDAAGTGNGAIECGGSFTAVWYGLQIFVNGKAGPETPVHAKASATLDISNVTAISTTPVVTAPTGDTTYMRLDAGNSPATGAWTFNSNVTVGGTLTSQTINGLYNAGKFSSISAALTAAIAAGSPGVWIPCGTYSDNITITSSVTLEGEDKACVTISPLVTANPVIKIDGTNVASIDRLTIKALTLTCPSGACGDGIFITGKQNANEVMDHLILEDLLIGTLYTLNTAGTAGFNNGIDITGRTITSTINRVISNGHRGNGLNIVETGGIVGPVNTLYVTNSAFNNSFGYGVKIDTNGAFTPMTGTTFANVETTSDGQNTALSPCAGVYLSGFWSIEFINHYAEANCPSSTDVNAAHVRVTGTLPSPGTLKLSGMFVQSSSSIPYAVYNDAARAHGTYENMRFQGAGSSGFNLHFANTTIDSHNLIQNNTNMGKVDIVADSFGDTHVSIPALGTMAKTTINNANCPLLTNKFDLVTGCTGTRFPVCDLQMVAGTLNNLTSGDTNQACRVCSSTGTVTLTNAAGGNGQMNFTAGANKVLNLNECVWMHRLTASDAWQEDTAPAARVQAAAGSQAAPSIAFANDTTTGFQNASGGVGTLMMTISGADTWQFSPSVMRGRATGIVGFSSAGNPSSAGSDVGIARAAANVLEVTTAESANSNGTLKAAAILSGGAAATLTGTGACATFSTQTGGSMAGRATCTAATAASTLTITPGTTAPNGWVCYVQDQTTRANLFQQTATVAASCTLTATSVTQNDVIVFTAIAF